MSNQPPQYPQGDQPGGDPNQAPPPPGQQGGYPPQQGQQGQQGGYPLQHGQQGGYPSAPQGQQGGYPSAPQQGGYGGAPQMPGSGTAPVGNVARPKSIDLAVKLMYVGAGLSLLGVLASFLMRGTIEDQVRDNMAQTGQDVNVDAVVTASMAFAIVIGLIGVALWLLMAKFNGDGKSWARIVATILGGLNILFTLLSFTQPSSPLNRILSIISALLAIAILVFLWKPESTAYYKAKSAPRM